MGPKISRLSRPWSTHISLHMLSSFPFFGMALSATSCVTSSGAVGAEGFGVAAKGASWGWRWGMAWMGQLRGVQQGSTVLVVRAMSRAANAMSMMWGL